MIKKLVRDKIPEVIEIESNQPSNYRIAKPDEMPELLRRKLQEEIGELEIALDSGINHDILDELADVSEVLRAIGLSVEIKSQTVEARRKEKLLQRGGFKKRTVMNFPKS